MIHAIVWCPIRIMYALLTLGLTNAMMNSILLRRRTKVYLEPGSAAHSTGTMAALQRNIEPLGYILSPEVIQVARTLDDDALREFHNELLFTLRKMTGAHVSYTPMYPNFPEQVMDASSAELYFNAMVHYVGSWFGTRIMPVYKADPRAPLDGATPVKVIGPAAITELEEVAIRLLSAKTSISEADKEDLAWLVGHYGDAFQRFIPDIIPLKENVALLGALCMRSTNIAGTVLRHHIRTATDVLRLAVALSGGDISLAENTKFKAISKRDRRTLLSLLDHIGGGAEDMLRYPEVWKRLGERLHPGAYAKRFPQAHAAFQVVRDGLPFETFGRTIETALRERDVDGAIRLLKARPGELARRLDHLSRLRADGSGVIDAFQQVVSKVSTPVLLQVLAHFRSRNDARELRTFFPKGDIGKVRAIDNELEPLDPAHCKAIVAIAATALRQRFAQLPPLGRVFVDERLKRYTVPAGLRSAAKALRTVGRGSSIPFPQGSTLRLFIWWQDGNGATDIDLSAVGLDKDHRYVMDIAYYNLRDVGGHHSGDITSAPDGAAEFIDVEIDTCLARGIRYLVMNVNAFSSQPFCDLPECFAGFMMRSTPQSGEIFEARTVENKFDLSGRTRFCIPIIFDLQERQATWADVAMKHAASHANNVHNNMSSITILAKAMTSLVKPDLHTLFQLHAEARGEVVGLAEGADVIFGIDQGIMPTDTDRIIGDFL